MSSSDSLKVAVVTGGHLFDVRAFDELWRALPGIRGYVQSFSNFIADWGNNSEHYDCVVFYNFQQDFADTAVSEAEADALLGDLFESGTGAVVCHHALMAFPDWARWNELCNLENRSVEDERFDYFFDQSLECVCVRDHPVLESMPERFDLVDETYTLPEEPAADRLIETDHPNSATALAWTHDILNTRVVCLQPGHGPTAYKNDNIRTLLGNAIRWTSSDR